MNFLGKRFLPFALTFVFALAIVPWIPMATSSLADMFSSERKSVVHPIEREVIPLPPANRMHVRVHIIERECRSKEDLRHVLVETRLSTGEVVGAVAIPLCVRISPNVHKDSDHLYHDWLDDAADAMGKRYLSPKTHTLRADQATRHILSPYTYGAKPLFDWEMFNAESYHKK